MKISFIMYPDSNGRITVTDTLTFIKENVPQIKVPDMDITKIPLAALTLKDDTTKHCMDGYADAMCWIDGKCTKYELTLIFA